MILSTATQILQTIVNSRRTVADYRQTTDVDGASAQSLTIDAGDTVTQSAIGKFFAMQSSAAVQVTFDNGVSSETLVACKYCVIETSFESWSVYNNTTEPVTVSVFVGFTQS